MELKDFKEYSIKALLEYEQLNKELQTLKETYIISLNTFFKENKDLYYLDKEEFSKEFFNSLKGRMACLGSDKPHYEKN